MPFANQFRTDTPTGASLANQIDDFIAVDTKKALDERYSLEHQSLETGNTDPDNKEAQGRHIPGKVGCMFYGTHTALEAISSPGDGSIGYATDIPGFYHFIHGTGWTPLSMGTDVVLADDITLEITGAGAGGEAVLGMKHDHVQWVTQATLVDEAIILTDASLSNSFTVTLAGSRAMAAPTSAKEGATYIWIITQDAGGGNTLSFDSVFKFPDGLAPVLTTAGNAVDIVTGIYNGGVFLCSVMYDVK
jgi:hypothetical protein